MIVEVESNGNCEASVFARFKEIGPARSVQQVKLYNRNPAGLPSLKRSRASLARIIHEHFCCNRRSAATTSLRPTGSPLGPSTYCTSTPQVFRAPRVGLATRLSDFATNRHEQCGLEGSFQRHKEKTPGTFPYFNVGLHVYNPLLNVIMPARFILPT